MALEVAATPRPSVDLAVPLARLARTAAGEFTVDDMLHELCQVAGGAVEVDGVGVMGVDADTVRFVHADRGLVAAELLQEELQRGPCRDSASRLATVVVEDVAATDRWPELAVSWRRAGLGAIVAVPLLARGRPWGVLELYRSASSSWAEWELTAARALADVTASYLAMAADRDQARALRYELEHRATHDHLTGLPNRALLVDRVEHAGLTAERRGTAVALLLIDVAGFKDVNDTMGHGVGDAVLAEIARRLQDAVRENDTLARLSGDEFVVVCEDLRGTPSEMSRWVDELRCRIEASVRRPLRIAGQQPMISVNLGATVTRGRRSAKYLIGAADRDMYVARQQHGRAADDDAGGVERRPAGANAAAR